MNLRKIAPAKASPKRTKTNKKKGLNKRAGNRFSPCVLRHTLAPRPCNHRTSEAPILAGGADNGAPSLFHGGRDTYLPREGRAGASSKSNRKRFYSILIHVLLRNQLCTANRTFFVL
ncbi:hypothetical protein AVEN_223234-1 [Araneus ventricosus]|uniref:Uncharacterized protein n=1 Tax=Araneus ventricosus TaxID=182803 RepID=A0A4Y2WF92_ARAVE|nr:hypothetical protein AVEN_223234-1 [Araneus ventricosus]